MWYAVHETGSGRLVSIGTVLTQPLPPGLSAVPLGPAFDPSGQMWDVDQRQFVPAPVVPPVLDKRAFWQRFSATEREDILAAPTTLTGVNRRRAAAAVEYLRQLSTVDLADPEVRASVQQFESLGLLAPGRAAQALG